MEKILLEKKYPVDIIKAGVNAFNTQKELKYLKYIFPKYNPDIVVFVVLPNDLFDNESLVETAIASNNKEDNKEKKKVEKIRGKKSTFHSVLLAKRMLMHNDFLYSRLYAITARAKYYESPKSPTLKKQIKITKELLTISRWKFDSV